MRGRLTVLVVVVVLLVLIDHIDCAQVRSKFGVAHKGWRSMSRELNKGIW